MAERVRAARVGTAKAGVAVECLQCGHTSTLADEGGYADLPLVELTRRLRCSDCGSRAVKAARIQTPRDIAKLLRARMSGGS